nr:hypothetical protein [Tanacetum cinerariifolium]
MLHVLRVEMVINSPWMLSKNWLVQKQTAFGKDISNPFMADNLPKIVTSEEVVREILQLNDAEGIICLPNEEIFAGLARMGYEKPSTKLTFYKAFLLTQRKFFIHTILHSLSAKRTSWNEFSSAMASAFICLSSGQRFNFSKYIFESLVRNVDSSSKFYMYPRFIQLIIQTNIADLSTHTTRYISPVLTQKVFPNIRRVGKGFLGVETPLFEKEVATDVVLPTPTSPSPSSPVISSSPPHQSPCPPQPQDAKGSSHLFQQVLDTCSAYAHRVEVLENDKVAQQLEIVKLKARVKKLEKLNKGRISVDMDQDEGIELVVDHEKDVEVEGRHADKQEEIFNIDLDHSSKVLSMQEDDTEVQEAVEVVTTAKLMTKVVTAAATQVVATNPEEELHTDTPAETPTVKDKGKGILIEAPNPMKKKDQVEMDAEYAKKLQEELDKEHEEAYKNIDWNASLDHVQSKEPQYIKRYHGIKKNPQSKSEARKNMISYLKNTEGYKMEFFKGKTEEMEKEDEEIIKIINEIPAQKAAKRRKLSEEAQEADDLKKRLEIVQDKDDDVFVKATLLAQKVPVVDYQIVMIDNKPKYKIIIADETHQFYISFTTLLKNFDREDLETLWRIVRDRFSTSKPTNFSDEYLLLTLKTMFGELDGHDAIWRNQKSVHGLALVKRWKLLTSCGVHVIILLIVQLFLLVERRYRLSRFTLEQLVNVARLQVEKETKDQASLTKTETQCLTRSKKNTKCVSAANEELTAAKHKLKLFKDAAVVAHAKNLGEPSSLFDFEEVMNNNHNQELPPQNNNGPPPMMRPNGQASHSMEELCQPSINGRGGIPFTLLMI